MLSRLRLAGFSMYKGAIEYNMQLILIRPFRDISTSIRVALPDEGGADGRERRGEATYLTFKARLEFVFR
ncbi:hypothetical protein NDU88_002020 [Pleurodeles waltl]|uniref:Uncharacterized protein n=1 Tax=Pleurodeles waltl TaxID=8319 RepID=A0AAV7WNA0_PLEWA|nr:hypothetical protein NDU88_002020 [Pleurodeles waltl]